MERSGKGDRFEQIIGQRLAATRVPGDAQCPDASIIAAYSESSLGRDERAYWERHFAHCARCQSALSAFARIGDVVGADGANVRAGAGARRGWWRLPGPLPIAAIGAAAALLVVVALRTFTAQRNPIDHEAASEFQSEQIASSAAPTNAIPKSAGAIGGGNSVMAMNEAASAKQVSPPLPQSSAPAAPAPPAPARMVAREEARSSSHDELSEKKTRAPELSQQSTAVGATPAPASAIGAANGVAGSTMAGSGASIDSAMPGASAIVVEPPDHAVVWMIGAHGAISRYSHGNGWVTQASGVTADLTAGSAPSASHCWIVGRGGTILRTVDGVHWTKVAAPVNDDLTGVFARSATAATISTANGRRFATSDGGANWRQL